MRERELRRCACLYPMIEHLLLLFWLVTIFCIVVNFRVCVLCVCEFNQFKSDDFSVVLCPIGDGRRAMWINGRDLRFLHASTYIVNYTRIDSRLFVWNFSKEMTSIFLGVFCLRVQVHRRRHRTMCVRNWKRAWSRQKLFFFQLELFFFSYMQSRLCCVCVCVYLV